MKFEYPNGTRKKPDLGWVWTQCMHMLELKDAVTQQWYAGFRHENDALGGAPRTRENLDKEINAIGNLRLGVMSLEKTLTSRKESLLAEYGERVQYDKERRK